MNKGNPNFIIHLDNCTGYLMYTVCRYRELKINNLKLINFPNLLTVLHSQLVPNEH